MSRRVLDNRGRSIPSAPQGQRAEGIFEGVSVAVVLGRDELLVLLALVPGKSS